MSQQEEEGREGFEISEIVSSDRQNDLVTLWWWAPARKRKFDSWWQRVWRKAVPVEKWTDQTSLSRLGTVLQCDLSDMFETSGDTWNPLNPSARLMMKATTKQTVAASCHIVFNVGGKTRKGRAK